MEIGPNSPHDQKIVEYESLVTKQRLEYQHIRNKADSIMQTVLAIISIVISVGLIRFLLSGEAIQRAPLEFSDHLANRCSAEAFTHSDASLIGLGPTISVTAVGLLILSAYLIVEMWMTNRAVQGMPRSLRPRNEADFWVGSHREWISDNQEKIDRSDKLRTSIKKRLHWSIGLILLAMALIATVYYDQAVVALVVGLLLIAASVIYLTGYVRQHYLSKVFEHPSLQVGISFTAIILILGMLVLYVWITHVLFLPYLGLLAVLSALFYSAAFLQNDSTDKGLKFNKWETQVFHLRSRGLSPVFLSLATIVLSYLAGKYIQIGFVIDRFLIC